MTDQERLAALKATVAELEAKIEGEKPSKFTLECLEGAMRTCSHGLGPGGAHYDAADTLRDLRVRGGKLLATPVYGNSAIAFSQECCNLLRDLGVEPTP